jgi:hypothetical protein
LNVASTTLALTIKPRKRYLSDSWEIKVCRENKTDGGGKNYVGISLHGGGGGGGGEKFKKMGKKNK